MKGYFNNEIAKGYLLKSLNYLIEKRVMDNDTAQKVMNSYHVELDIMTEGEAEEYYRNNFLRKK